jgi:hypothetical protein
MFGLRRIESIARATRRTGSSPGRSTSRTGVLNVAGGMNAWLAADLPAARCLVSRRTRSTP